MADYIRGYNVFEAIRQRIRSRALTRQQQSMMDQTQAASPEKVDASSSAPTPSGPASGVNMYDSPFLETPDITYTMNDSTITAMPTEQYQGLSQYGQLQGEKITGAEAAAKTDLGYYGPYDPNSTLGKSLNSLVAALDPTPFGMFGGLLSGTTTVDPYGKTVAKPVGMLGKVAEMNIEKQYEVAEKIRAGTPGFHQFYSGGQLVSLTPQTLFGKEVGYAVLGTFQGSPQQAINQYAATMGYDPETVDLKSRPGMRGFGVELDAFVPGSGGYAKDGMFVDPAGNRRGLYGNDLMNHIGLTADIYGTAAAINALNQAKLSPEDRNEAMSKVQEGLARAEAVLDKNGDVVGYETGAGSVVRSTDGSIVTSGDGKTPVTSGMGIMSVPMYESLKAESQFMADSGGDWSPTEGTQTVGGKEYTTVSGGSGDGRGKGDDTFFGGSDYDPGFDDGDTGDTGGTDQASADAAGGSSMSSPFAEGGPVTEGSGGNAPVVAAAGFVGQEPESLPDGMTVADDVPMDVPEGTFVLNAAAVEFMGSADVKKMILEAMQEAEKQGIDIEQDDATIAKEDLVSLVVSKGEVIIPPQLAEIIGYDRLTKINNRGKAETQKRIDENGQSPEAGQVEPTQRAADGGAFGNYNPRDEELTYSRAILEAVEGMASEEPHVPSKNSGLTIGRGFDLGQHSEFDLKNRYGFSDEFIKKAKPFLAPAQGKKGPTGPAAEKLYRQSSVDFSGDSQEVSDRILNLKFEEFEEAYPQYREAIPKDKAALFSMYYLGGLDRYKTLQRTYDNTGDIPRAIDEGILKKVTKGSPEYNRGVNLLTFYYTADDADVLEQNPTPGKQQAYAMDMLKAQKKSRQIGE